MTGVDVPLMIACVVGIAVLCLFYLWLENMNRHSSPGLGRKELGGWKFPLQNINANTNEFLREMREKEASESSSGNRKPDAQSKTARDSEE